MSQHKMQGQRAAKPKKSSRIKSASCRALCCTNCRVSVSTEEVDSSGLSDRFASVSSLAHYMVQERLDQMIKESEEEDRARRLIEVRKGKQKKVVKNTNISTGSCSSHSSSRRIAMVVAMEKCTRNPREDFKKSMVEVIMANQIEKPKDLRSILNCYLSMNSDEYKEVILEAFHQVCTDIFFCCKCHR